MRLSVQMKKMLLTLLKAEEDISSVVLRGPKHGAQLDRANLIRFIEDVYRLTPRYHSKSVSYGRSLKRLEKLGLVKRTDAPEWWGAWIRNIYQLSVKGRKIAKQIRKDIKNAIAEYSKFI